MGHSVRGVHHRQRRPEEVLRPRLRARSLRGGPGQYVTGRGRPRGVVALHEDGHPARLGAQQQRDLGVAVVLDGHPPGLDCPGQLVDAAAAPRGPGPDERRPGRDPAIPTGDLVENFEDAVPIMCGLHGLGGLHPELVCLGAPDSSAARRRCAARSPGRRARLAASRARALARRLRLRDGGVARTRRGRARGCPGAGEAPGDTPARVPRQRPRPGARA